MWSDDGVERVARLLEEVRLNGARLGFQGTRDANMRRLRYIGNTHGMFSGNNLPWELLK